jgi:hypothetical protein
LLKHASPLGQEVSMKKILFNLKIFFTAFFILLTSSCGQTPKLPQIPGIKGPQFNLLDGKVMITIKLIRANLNIGAKVPIPKTKDSFFEVSPNLEDGGTIVVFYLDVEDIKDMNIGIGEGNTLPDGRPIPGVPGGTLQSSLRADTELLDMSFYFHKKLFGFYIPIGWDTHGIAGYWNIVVNEKNIGVLGSVASDQQGNGAGLILFLRLDQLQNKQLQQMLRLSRQNPSVTF